MGYGEALAAADAEARARDELNGTPEEFQHRQEIINRGESLVDSLGAYLGADITPIVADAEADEIDFTTNMVFLVDGKYVFYHRTYGTFDGYDMWEVSFPRLRKSRHDQGIWGRVELSGYTIGYDFTIGQKLECGQPLQRSDLVDKLGRIEEIPIADTVVNDSTFLDLVIEQFKQDFMNRPVSDLRV